MSFSDIACQRFLFTSLLGFLCDLLMKNRERKRIPFLSIDFPCAEHQFLRHWRKCQKCHPTLSFKQSLGEWRSLFLSKLVSMAEAEFPWMVGCWTDLPARFHWSIWHLINFCLCHSISIWIVNGYFPGRLKSPLRKPVPLFLFFLQEESNPPNNQSSRQS